MVENTMDTSKEHESFCLTWLLSCINFQGPSLLAMSSIDVGICKATDLAYINNSENGKEV